METDKSPEIPLTNKYPLKILQMFQPLRKPFAGGRSGWRISPANPSDRLQILQRTDEHRLASFGLAPEREIAYKL